MVNDQVTENRSSFNAGIWKENHTCTEYLPVHMSFNSAQKIK